MHRVTEFEDAEALNRAAASFFVRESHAALERSGNFCVVLSGGSSPHGLYELLATDRFWRAVPWDRTHVFWADERMVGPDHEWSNYGVARDLLLSRVPVPTANIHRIPGEKGAHDAAQEYRRELVNLFGAGAMPQMDLVLMGMGADGHAASLFPGCPALDSVESVEPVAATNDMPEPAVDRVTMTLPCLNAANTVLYLVSGADKAATFKAVRDGHESLPAARIRAQRTEWFVDRAALGRK